MQWFRETEAQQLLAASREAYPRWYPFLVVSFGAGLRWGEATALHRTDIEWTRQRLHVQRTWSEDGGRFEACKDGEARRVAVAPAVLEALREHLANAELEGAVKRWDAEQRRLVFPNSRGRVTRYGTFMEHFWKPVLTLAGLPYRKPHAMRHSYATWQLEGGADLRWVKDQMGHASIEETEGTYGHLEPARHEHQGVEVLGRILKGAP